MKGNKLNFVCVVVGAFATTILLVYLAKYYPIDDPSSSKPYDKYNSNAVPEGKDEFRFLLKKFLHRDELLGYLPWQSRLSLLNKNANVTESLEDVGNMVMLFHAQTRSHQSGIPSILFSHKNINSQIEWNENESLQDGDLGKINESANVFSLTLTQEKAFPSVHNILRHNGFIDCQPKTEQEIGLLKKPVSDECKLALHMHMCLNRNNLLYPEDILNLEKNQSCSEPVPLDVAYEHLLKYQHLPSISKEETPSRNWNFLQRLPKPIRIAFMFVVHGRAVDTVSRILASMYKPQHYYLIHVDTRSSYLFSRLHQICKGFSNVILSSIRFDSIWGAANLFKVYSTGISSLIPFEWDYFVNLSGADLPLHPVDELANFLANFAPRKINFLTSHGSVHEQFIQKQGFDHTFVQCDHHMHHIGERKLPPSLEIAGGSDWFMLHRSFALFSAFSPENIHPNYMTMAEQHLKGKEGVHKMFSEQTLIKEIYNLLGMDNKHATLLTQLRSYYDRSLLSAESFFHIVSTNTRLKYCSCWFDAFRVCL
eukprot:m.291 g.291  ORF g.291 m.291 type:complete len:538 (+) comp143_c0_seq1:42-1655(+)